MTKALIGNHHTILLDGVPWRHFTTDYPLTRAQKLKVMLDYAKREGVALGGLEIKQCGWIVTTGAGGKQERRAG